MFRKTAFSSILALTASLAVAACSMNADTSDAAERVELTTFAELSDTRPGNIAVLPEGRVILTQQPLDNPELRVVELKADGTKAPFPTLDWADGPEKGEVGFAATLGIKSDSNGVVWILDMGGGSTNPQLVGWDTNTDALVKTIEIPAETVTPVSFLQDFVLDEERGKAYISDMTFTAPVSDLKPAFIVVDLETGEARRVLESAAELMPAETDVVVGDQLVGFKDEEGNPQPWHLPFNALSIDPDFEYVYFGTINGSDVMRIPAEGLANTTEAQGDADQAALAASIERYAQKAPNDGFIVDREGRVYSGDVTTNALTVSTPDSFEVFAKDDKRLRWPDGFTFGPDGTLYVVASQLNTHPALNMGKDDSDKPYYILTVKP
ncbi:MAG: L-dopachrome tautomerase-related protein [Pseudomonadota bacterium]|nr:L-dopachrome tautomerase-related protein [Pseudomonadota bacterium]